VPGEVILADFMANTVTAQAYDIVLSLGFIEHFEDPWPVIARHAQLIKPGGKLVLEVPNYTGLNGWILKQSSHHYLDIHNTSVMRLAFFQEIAMRFDLVPRFIGLVGGPEPGLWDATGQRPLLLNLIRIANRARQLMPFLDHVNHSFFSGYLVGIYQKGDY
jgi:SAM-dependent methyltransferase